MEFIFPVRVYYEDTDVAGVVYHANYLKYFERGRTEWLRELGLEQDILIEQDTAFAISKAEVDYLRPARFNDALEVVTRIERASGACIYFEQFIRQAQQQEQILCRARIKVACVQMSCMKAKKIPQPVLETLTHES